MIYVLLGACLIYNLLSEETTLNAELRKQIGQMLLVGFRGTEVDASSPIVKTIRKYNLGGVVLSDYDVPSRSFPRNIINPYQVRKLTDSLQKLSPTPLFIAIDVEGGQINRLKAKYGFKDFPSHQALGQANDLKKTSQVASEIAAELQGLGINWNFAPDVDLNLNPQNPIIGGRERAFAADPDTVTRHAEQFIRAHHQHRIICALKHFPGHGSSRADSHRGLVDITDTWKDVELEPYRRLSRLNLIDAVMTAHVVNRKIDSNFPATLSDKFLKGILRQEVKFNGVIITDDMGMGAITQHYGFEEALVRAVNAGADILLLANNGTTYDEKIAERAANALIEAVAKGKIPAARIRESYHRIITLKKQYNLL
jgi:beta-N-acetylhexosaminidase